MQPEANLRIGSRKEQKLKLGSPQRHLAKPAAKRAPSRGDKGKKPLGAKTQQKRPRHAALTPTNAWRSAQQACLRDRRGSRPRGRLRATRTSVVDADARTASLKNAPPRCETALRQRIPQTPRRELHPADAVGVHRPRAARFPRPPCLHARLGPARCRCVDGVRDGPYRLDAVDAAPPPPREKENKKNTGANFIPLTPLAFIDRARHVSRVLHVFGLVPDGFVTSSTRGSARHVVAASMA